MLFFVKLKEENNLPETINQVLPSFEVIFLSKMKKVWEDLPPIVLALIFQTVIWH